LIVRGGGWGSRWVGGSIWHASTSLLFWGLAKGGGGFPTHRSVHSVAGKSRHEVDGCLYVRQRHVASNLGKGGGPTHRSVHSVVMKSRHGVDEYVMQAQSCFQLGRGGGLPIAAYRAW